MKRYKKLTTSVPKTEEICRHCKKDCRNDEGATLIWCCEFKVQEKNIIR